MAIDLGINKPAGPPKGPMLNPIDLICPVMTLDVTDDPEARRTLLGCYFLTSSYVNQFLHMPPANYRRVCQSLRKPNNMRYTDYVGECCSYLAQKPEVDTDHLLQYFVKLQHFQEDVNAAFDYDSIYNLQPLDSARIEILLGSFQRQLVQMEETFPPEIWQNSKPVP